MFPVKRPEPEGRGGIRGVTKQPSGSADAGTGHQGAPKPGIGEGRRKVE